MFCYRLWWLIPCVGIKGVCLCVFQLGWTTLRVYFHLFKRVSASTVGFHLLSVSLRCDHSITADTISYMYLWCKALPWYNIFIWNLSFYFGRPTSCFRDDTEWELPCYLPVPSVPSSWIFLTAAAPSSLSFPAGDDGDQREAWWADIHSWCTQSYSLHSLTKPLVRLILMN